MKDVRELNVQNFVDCVEPFVCRIDGAKRLESVRFYSHILLRNSDVDQWRKKLREHWKMVEWSKCIKFKFWVFGMLIILMFE